MNNNQAGIIIQKANELGRLLPKTKKLFFVGIGGVSMSALAILAKQAGYTVSGSDRVISKNTDMLEKEGICVFHEHKAENIEGADALIYNAAIGETNPEFAAAKKKGLLLIYRADFLTFLTYRYHNGIGVAGMHGKTTTSAMLSHLFLSAGRDPAILIGAELPELGRDFRAGGGEDFIFEACEYRDSFLSFLPHTAVILNEEMDHPDWFKSLEQVRNSFTHFMEITGEEGNVVLNADDENVLLSAETIPARRVTFGIKNSSADFRAEEITYEHGCASFTVLHGGEEFCRIRLSVPGEHNVMNALACSAAAWLSGLTKEQIEEGISTFTGAARRMEYKGTLVGCDVSVPVYDDFGHHPSEVKTTLEGAKRMGYKRLRCVYQPHTYSRTAGLFEEFCHAFGAADEVIFADIYAAREQNTFGVSSEQLAEKIPGAKYMPDFDETLAYLQKTSRDGDLLVIMGAGDISHFADKAAK